MPTEHTGRFSIWINPFYTQFVPAALLFVVFILTFFPWDCFCPGGVWVDWQNAWQATFGSTSTDADLAKVSLVQREAEAVDPGFDVLLLFYLLALFLNLFLLSAALVGPFKAWVRAMRPSARCGFRRSSPGSASCISTA